MVLMWLHTALLGAAALVPFGLLVALMMSNWRGGGRKRRHPDDTAEQTPKTSAPLQWSSLPPPSCPDPSALSAAGGSKTGRARAPANPGHGWLPAPNTTEPAAHASPGDPERPPPPAAGSQIVNSHGHFPRKVALTTNPLPPCALRAAPRPDEPGPRPIQAMDGCPHPTPQSPLPMPAPETPSAPPLPPGARELSSHALKTTKRVS